MAQPVSRAASPPKPPGKKVMGLSPTGWIIVLGVGLAAGAYFLIRNRNKQAAASSTSTGSAQGTTDSTGNDYAGQISTLQTEIADLQGELAERHHHRDRDHHHRQAGGGHREIADGTKSLNQVASERHTDASHIIAVTRASREISRANLARFNKYVAGGTNRKMPAGLVFYTTHSGSGGGYENVGGGGTGTKHKSPGGDKHAPLPKHKSPDRNRRAHKGAKPNPGGGEHKAPKQLHHQHHQRAA